ncbi:MAG: hypothetical protein GYA24_09805 [Candidatus Lokiarchaeota archaeon]|nr:hypothetical protein [Candidatus Lokiarchaeota archaeon]
MGTGHFCQGSSWQKVLAGTRQRVNDPARSASAFTMVARALLVLGDDSRPATRTRALAP